MIASAVIDWWKFKVPNWLTLPVIMTGWLFGLTHTLSWHLIAGDGSGGVGASLAGTVMGFCLLLPMYAIGGMGAGDVKMTMGFGSWAGAFFGMEDGLCLWVILYAFCAGAIAGGVIAVGMMLVRGEFRQNLQHTRIILIDLFTAGSLGRVAEKANERRPRWHRLPYGVPLCIGFVGYLLLAGSPLADQVPAPQTRQNPVQMFAPVAGGSTLFPGLPLSPSLAYSPQKRQEAKC
jgi:prepilin peptidase CpaA